MLEKLYSAATQSAHVVGLLLSTSLTLACQEGTTDPGGNGGGDGGGVVVPPGYFVSPSGAAGSNGTIESPWDLQTVLGKGAELAGTRLTPIPDGDGGTLQATVVWVRGGSYGTNGELKQPTLQGTAANPVILRAYPGERVTFDHEFHTNGAPDLWFWGIEVTNTIADVNGTSGHGAFDLRNARQRLIHCVIHNQPQGGVGWWNSVTGHSELYGNLIYNNGAKTEGDPYSHGIYAQNVDPNTKEAKHNVIFHNFDHNIHQFSGGSGGGQGFSFIENVMIGWGNKGVGGIGWVFNASPEGDLLIDGMMGYTGSPSTEPGPLGAIGPLGSEYAARLTFINGYMRAGGYQIQRWQDMTFTNNTWISLGQSYVRERDLGANPAWTFDDQTYFADDETSLNQFRFQHDIDVTEVWPFTDWQTNTGYDANSTYARSASGKPTTNQVFTFVSEYEPKGDAIATQGLIVIFNWEDLANVSVDVSSILNVNDVYNVYHVFDRFGTSVASGTYAGGAISVPMTAVAPPEPTTGWPEGVAPPTPGPEFGTFIIVKQ